MFERLLRSVTRENSASGYDKPTGYASIRGAREELPDGPGDEEELDSTAFIGALQRSGRFAEDSGDQSFVIL
jgi:hypothetical protein